MDPGDYVIYIAIILLLGTLSSALAYKLKTSNVFFLILIGMVFGTTNIISFPESAIITISVIALILVIFDSTNKLSIKEFLRYSQTALKLILIFLILNLVFMTISVKLLFGADILLSLLFAAIVYGIDPMIALSIFKDHKGEIVNILKIESIINTPLTIIIPFLIIGMIEKTGFAIGDISSQIVPFIQQIILGVGIGIIIGFVVVMIMKKAYMGDLSHLALITAAIITYVASERIGGNGVLAITAFGLIFGNLKMHHKIELENFASIFSYTLEILVFILMGTFLVIKPEYILKGTILFLIYIPIRFVSVMLSFPKFKLREKIFMSLNVPKGIDVAIIVLLLLSQFKTIEGIGLVVNLSLLFILYSIVLSTVVGALMGKSVMKPDENTLRKHQGNVIHKILTHKIR